MAEAVVKNDVESYQLVLASASPRRLKLLQQLRMYPKVHPVDIDETALSGELPLEFVGRMALEKARAGSNDMINQGINLPVLGSDTIVEIDGEILGKPDNVAQAVMMLKKLSGKKHKVHTAVTAICAEGEYSEVSTSEVEFALLAESDIRAYVESGEPLDKAGAYAIQGIAAQFVKNIHGSYSGVMGLPLFETAKVLRAVGIKTI